MLGLNDYSMSIIEYLNENYTLNYISRKDDMYIMTFIDKRDEFKNTCVDELIVEVEMCDTIDGIRFQVQCYLSIDLGSFCEMTEEYSGYYETSLEFENAYKKMLDIWTNPKDLRKLLKSFEE